MLQFIKRDIRLGLINNWYKYIFIVFIVVEDSLLNMSIWHELEKDGAISGGFSVMNLLFGTFKGEAYTPVSINDGFVLPIYWFCIQLGIHYIIAYYALKDFKENGKILTLAGGSRGKFWIGKCAWCFAAVVLYYLVIGATIFLLTFLYGGSFNTEYKDFISQYEIYDNVKYINQREMILIVLLIGIVTFALCLFQMTISMMTSAVTSFSIICTIYVASAYYLSPFLPGNYTMIRRSSFISIQGVSPYSGLVMALMIILLSVSIGYAYIKRVDIF